MPTIATPVTDRVVSVKPARDAAPRLARERPGVALLGRIALSAIFLVNGAIKLLDAEGTLAHMQTAGVPYPETLRLVAGVAELAGGLAILLGLLTRIGAAGLVLYLIPTTIFFHAAWMMDGDASGMELLNLLKNLAIMGGLALLVAFGAGARSVDAAIARRRQPRVVPSDRLG